MEEQPDKKRLPGCDEAADLSSIIEKITDSVCAVDPGGRITLWNGGAEKTFGFSAREILGSHISVIIPEELRATEIDDCISELRTKGYFSGHESVRLTKDCRPVPVEIAAISLEDAAGNICGYASIMRDISDRKKNEESLHDITGRKEAEESVAKSKERYRSLFLHLISGFAFHEMIFDEHGVPVDYIFLEVNRSFERFTGLRRADIIGRKVTEVIPDIGKAEPNLIAIYGKVAASGEPARFDLYFAPLDRWYEISAYSPEKGYFVTIFDDISERKKAEDKIRESEEWFRNIYDSASDGIFLMQPSREDPPVIVNANEAACRMNGYLKEEMIGKPISILDIEETRRNTRDMVRRLQKGEHLRVELNHIRKDGTVFPVEISAKMIRVGGRDYIVSLERDITNRKKMEEELAQAHKLESIGVLAGGLAHDFNNLLTGILGNISIAMMHAPLGKEAMNRLADAVKASERAKALTHQLLTFAKGGEPIKTVCPLDRIVRETAEFVLRGANVKVEITAPVDLWPVEADEGQIGQIISNLVMNADQSMPGGGVIEILMQNRTVTPADNLPLEEGRYVNISIKDSGPGIQKENLGKIFDPYFTTRQRGRGLGLAVVHSIIRRHGGHIEVESEMGTGAAFHIYLPAAEARHIAAAADTKRKGGAERSGRGKIMVMDDEELVRDVAKEMLVRLGYAVELFENGSEALEGYRKAISEGEPFTAVILDLTIPGGMGGKELILKLREIDPDVRAIVSSGYANDAIMSGYEKFGFRGVVTKPYTIERLSRTLADVTA